MKKTFWLVGITVILLLGFFAISSTTGVGNAEPMTKTEGVKEVKLYTPMQIVNTLLQTNCICLDQD